MLGVGEQGKEAGGRKEVGGAWRDVVIGVFECFGWISGTSSILTSKQIIHKVLVMHNAVKN